MRRGSGSAPGSMTGPSDKINGPGPADTETVDQCPLCGSSDSTLLFNTFDRLYRLPGSFPMLSCGGCGLFRLSPRPTPSSIGTYYPDDYGAYATPTSPNGRAGGIRRALREGVRASVLSSLGYDTGRMALWQRIFQPLFVRRFYQQATYSYGDRFPRFAANGKALEVGCGRCTFLGLLKRHGWNVTGVDMSPHAAQSAKEAFDIDVIVGQLEDAGLESETFDYVHLSHVVEHFFDPLATMKIIARLLKPNGIAYIEVPNGKGLGAEMSGEYWYGWDPPRHLFTFTPDTFRMLMDKAGLSIRKMKTGLSDTFDWEIAFRNEDAAGKILSRPPSLNYAEEQTAKGRMSEAEDQFLVRPNDGDFIACWVEKPAAFETGN